MNNSSCFVLGKKTRLIKKSSFPTVERCIKDNKVFAYDYGNKWIINYNHQLETVIEEYFRKTNYKIRRLKRKKNTKKTESINEV